MPRAQLLIRLFYLFQVTVTMMLWMPIFYKYQQQMGLSDPQIFQIQSIYYLSFCLLEIPTGFLADRLGHRGCMRVGAALHILTHLLPVMAPTYQGFLWHWLLLALSRSLISGAASAYLYNQLEALGQSELYKEAEGRGRAWSLAAKVVGFYFTDHLVALSPSLPYTTSAASAVLATLIAFRFPKALPVAGARPGGADTPRVGEVLRILLRSPAMLVVIGQGVALFTLTRIVQVNLFQPLLLAQNYSQFGTVLAINTLCEAVGAAYPKALRRWMSDLAAVFWLTLAMGLCCWGLTLPGASNCFWWLNAFAVVTGLSYPIQRQVMNEHIPDSRYRASLLSAESLVDRAVCAWVAHQLGSILQAGQMGMFLHYSALASVATCLILAPLYALLRLRHKG
jgi:MFS family permease